MRSFTPSVQASLDAGDVVSRDMIKLALPSGTYGFWSGLGELFYDGVTYEGAGSLLEIDVLVAGTDAAARTVEVSLSAQPNTALTNDILATFYQEDFNQKPAEILTAFIDPDTRAVLAVERFFAGRIDKAPMTAPIGEAARLTLRLESREGEFSQQGYRRRNATDQGLIDATDNGLDHVINTAEDRNFVWGRSASG